MNPRDNCVFSSGISCVRKLVKLPRNIAHYRYEPGGRKIRSVKGNWGIPDLKYVSITPRKSFKSPESAKQYRKQRRNFIQHNAKVKLMRHLKEKKLITDAYDYYSHWHAKVRLLRLLLQKETGRYYRIAKVRVRDRKYFFRTRFSFMRISAMLLNPDRARMYLIKARADALNHSINNGIAVQRRFSLRHMAPTDRLCSF